jgi:hypothetical protein
MVKHHILIGLGFKKNIRNRALNYMMNRGRKAVSNIVGCALPENQMTIQPVARTPPKFGGAVARRPLKFNY